MNIWTQTRVADIPQTGDNTSLLWAWVLIGVAVLAIAAILVYRFVAARKNSDTGVAEGTEGSEEPLADEDTDEDTPEEDEHAAMPQTEEEKENVTAEDTPAEDTEEAAFPAADEKDDTENDKEDDRSDGEESKDK